uniref:Uncharacterized protein n=1 Tax=Branchiostoma floridae TaxID=7739 RepID=C3ZCL5_BRAFL|eukprot:XP_002593708.1 hypothetical protein BRAFLDRAFT_64005 [Branchiostoma floridae]
MGRICGLAGNSCLGSACRPTGQRVAWAGMVGDPAYDQTCLRVLPGPGNVCLTSHQNMTKYTCGYFPDQHMTKCTCGYFPDQHMAKYACGYFPDQNMTKYTCGYFPDQNMTKYTCGYFPDQHMVTYACGYFPDQNMTKYTCGYFPDQVSHEPPAAGGRLTWVLDAAAGLSDMTCTGACAPHLAPFRGAHLLAVWETLRRQDGEAGEADVLSEHYPL